MKKVLCLLLVAIMSISVFAGCKSDGDSKKIKIVTTIFPCYDWTREILGDKIADVELTYLLNNGVDLHSYQLTSGDRLSIKKSDLFIYVGGESDTWVEDVIKGENDINAINMMEVLKNSLLEEEVIEGMEVPHEEEEEGEEETEYDEHIWLSLRNASIICDEICNRLCKIDSKNSETYKKNNKDYKTKLIDLFDRYSKVVENGETKTILVADRFPFRYLTDDFGLKYYAAFVGCSTESDASFKTISFLTNKLISENLSTVIVLDGSNRRIAETIISGSKLNNIQILEMNSMQTATVSGNENDTTYLSIAESNLKTLEKALKTRG